MVYYPSSRGTGNKDFRAFRKQLWLDFVFRKLKTFDAGTTGTNAYGFSIHTYIHNWLLPAFSEDYDLASHTTYVEGVNFIREWRELQFKVHSERQILGKLFHGNFIYS